MRTLISVLGGGIWKDENGAWRTSDNNAPYGNVPRFGRWRVEAAAMLYRTRVGYQDRPDDKTYLLTHGRGMLPEKPSNAEVACNELIELNVPREVIALDPLSHDTFSELYALNRRVEALGIDLVWVVSNDWHVPRIRAMLEYLPDLHQLAAHEPQPVSCESVLLGNDA